MNALRNLVPIYDEQLVRDVLDALRRPTEIRNVVYEFGVDWSGDPAVRIWVEIAPDPRPDAAKMAHLSDYTRAVSDRLLDQGIQHWPYVHIREVA